MSKIETESSQNLTRAELLVHALVIEMEAMQTYTELAEQMDQCGNPQVAGLFGRMAELEAEHADRIRAAAGDVELPEPAPWEFRWPGPDAPENVDLAAVHYLMTPHQALRLALDNELGAMAFFDAIAKDSTDDRVRSLAREFADDERQHVAWMKDWLAKYPPPDEGWDYDPDPPAALD